MYKVKYLIKYCLIILLLISSILFNTKNVYAQDFLFLDTFDTYREIWEEHATNGEWRIDNGEYYGSSVNYQPIQPSYTVAGNPNWQNYTFRFRIKGELGVDKAVSFRIDENGRYYGLNIISSYSGKGNIVQLGKALKIGKPEGELLREVPFPNIVGNWYDVRIDVLNISNSVSIKIYLSNNLLLEYEDSDNPIFHGSIGLFIWPGGAGSPNSDGYLTTATRYDDIIVTHYGEILSIPDNNINLLVPNIKQNFFLWKDNVYDNATVWSPTKPFIQTWGCALTSTVMVLRYHNHNIWPDSLNSWLNIQSDGFFRNGLLNWLAISRFTKNNKLKINEKITLPTLEYLKNKTPINENLVTELENNQPPIAKVPGHFVVITGKSNSDFTVNDPITDIRTLLSEVEQVYGNYTTINSYIPTSSDLSYILLITNKDSDLKIRYPDKSEVSQDYFSLEEPIKVINTDQQPNLPILKVFMLPKPQEGNYKVEILNSDNPYFLDSYLYNLDGEITSSSFERITPGKTPDIFNIVYSKSPKIHATETTFDSILDDLENIYNLNEIKNKFIYKILKREIFMSKFLYKKNKIIPTKNLLKNASNHVKMFTTRYISKNISNILISNLNFLINSL